MKNWYKKPRKLDTARKKMKFLRDASNYQVQYNEFRGKLGTAKIYGFDREYNLAGEWDAFLKAVGECGSENNWDIF